MANAALDAGGRPVGLRARNKAALAKRILEVARTAFEAEGVTDADLAEIARKARVGRATLYRYFDGKDALLRALMDEDWDAQARLFARLATAPVIDAAVVEDWLRLLIRGVAARLDSYPIYYAVGLSGLRRQRERLMDVLGERIAAFARPSGERRERAEALLLLLQIEEFTTHAAGAGDEAETDRGVELLVQRILAMTDPSVRVDAAGLA
jgi:AcrR family transcriptional regulator